jgi:prepilin-type N-terminal cleavage/methylation domain-containing protein
MFRNRTHTRKPPAGGFTLIEMLVVILIIMIVSAIAISMLPNLVGNYQVTEGARIMQAALAGARDAANRAQEPRGIRLMPDDTLSGSLGTPGAILASNRILQIEPAPDLTDQSDLGSATFPTSVDPMVGVAASGAVWTTGSPPPLPVQFPAGTTRPYPCDLAPPYTVAALVGSLVPVRQVLIVEQAFFRGNIGANIGRAAIPNTPTNWFWNVRLGEKVRFADSGWSYTIVGPMTKPNPELFVNDGDPGVSTLQETYYDGAGTKYTPTVEYLFLVNNVDDNTNGNVDEGMDGVDQNLNGTADDFLEWFIPNFSKTEGEAWVGTQALQADPTKWQTYPGPAPPAYVYPGTMFPIRIAPTVKWTITRRPVPSPGARETMLPGGAVIDMTTWNSTIGVQERSRLSKLAVNPFNGTVDIMLNPSGTVVPTGVYSVPSSLKLGDSFYHFWITERTDVYDAVGKTTFPQLPMPQSDDGLNHYPKEPVTTTRTIFLKKDRQLVTLFTRTGQVLTNSINNFDASVNASGVPLNPNFPYYQAQLGIREAK